MLELISLFASTLGRFLRNQHELVVENLLGWWSGGSAPTGSGISSWCSQKPSSAGTAEAGVSTGAGDQAVSWAAHD